MEEEGAPEVPLKTTPIVRMLLMAAAQGDLESVKSLVRSESLVKPESTKSPPELLCEPDRDGLYPG